MLAAVVIAVMIALNSGASAGEVYNPGYHAGLTLLFTILAVALAPAPGMVLSAMVKRESLEDAFSRGRTLRRVRIGMLCYQGYLLGAYALVTWWLEWPVLVDGTLGLGGWVLADELLRLAPFLGMVALAWVPLYRIDRKLRGGTWTLREYVEWRLRQEVLFVLVPFAALVTVVDVMGHLPWAETLERTRLDWVIALGTMGALFVFSPHLIRHVWKTRRMEEGPLRERLTALAARAKMRCRDILVWETLGGHVVNACVTGIIAPARYVLVTDALMESLSPEEVEGVFAHEVGHVRGRHILTYGAFTAGFLAAAVLAEAAAVLAGKAGPGWAGTTTLAEALVAALAALYWGAGFGFVSRRMELEADLYAVELTQDTGSFVNALERISYFSGRARTARSWRHYSIARRTEFLLGCETDGARRERFRRGMSMLRWGIVAFTAIACGGAAAILMK